LENGIAVSLFLACVLGGIAILGSETSDGLSVERNGFESGGSEEFCESRAVPSMSIRGDSGGGVCWDRPEAECDRGFEGSPEVPLSGTKFAGVHGALSANGLVSIASEIAVKSTLDIAAERL
jgi:hypothetical protein